MLFCIVTFNLWLHFNKLLTYLLIYLLTILSPVGKSDHNCVLVKPKCYYAYTKVESRVVTKQNLSEQVLDNLAYAINSIPGYVLYE